MVEKKIDKKSEQYKKLLLKIKETTIHDIKNMNANAPEDNPGDSGHALHIADVATDMYDREFNLGLASNDRELLYRVDLALKRIEQSDYGKCNVCKKPIPSARLKAIPYVETCVKCQEELENSR